MQDKKGNKVLVGEVNHKLCKGETAHLRLGLEPSHTSDGTQTQPKFRLGLEPPVFSLKSHTWSQDLMKLRFLCLIAERIQ